MYVSCRQFLIQNLQWQQRRNSGRRRVHTGEMSWSRLIHSRCDNFWYFWLQKMERVILLNFMSKWQCTKQNCFAFAKMKSPRNKVLQDLGHKTVDSVHYSIPENFRVFPVAGVKLTHLLAPLDSYFAMEN